MPRLQTLKPQVRALGTRLHPLGSAAAERRMRGRAAVDRRARWLYEHPLCQVCAQEHPPRVTAGDVVDHTIPIWAGGADDYEANGATICTPHHDAKTACEATMRAAGGWLSTPCTCVQHLRHLNGEIGPQRRDGTGYAQTLTETGNAPPRPHAGGASSIGEG